MSVRAKVHALPVSVVSGYHDSRFDIAAIKLLPADLHVTDRDIAIVTVLGSCVSACVRDALGGVGGMNHFMLPDSHPGDDMSARYGSNAMELLINGLLKAGARRERLEAKVFGGGNVLKGFTANPVGTRNAQFVRDYLRTENIQVLAEDLCGIHPRKVWFFPKSGRVVVQKLPHAHDDTIVREEVAYQQRISKQPCAGDVELFT